MAAEDAAATKYVRSQIARRYVDTSMLSIRVTHGVAHMTGVLGVLRAHREIDLTKEMALISTILRGKNGIRDVVWDVTLRS
jgi:hypothetical protein